MTWEENPRTWGVGGGRAQTVLRGIPRWAQTLVATFGPWEEGPSNRGTVIPDAVVHTCAVMTEQDTIPVEVLLRE